MRRQFPETKKSATILGTLAKEVGISLAKSEFGVPKGTSRELLSDIKNWSNEVATQQVQSEFDRKFHKLLTFLSTVSIRTKSKKPNSERLRRKFNVVHRSKRTTTKLQNIVAKLQELLSLDLIYNEELKSETFLRKKSTDRPSYVSFYRSAFEQTFTDRKLVMIIQTEGNRGETPYFEFKRDLNPKKDVETAEIIMTFANADSGILFYGWDQTKKDFCDINPEVIEQKVIQWTEKLITPSVPVETRIICHPKGRGLLILIPAVKHLVSVKNKIKARKGSHKVSLSGTTLTQVIRRRNKKPLGHLYLDYL